MFQGRSISVVFPCYNEKENIKAAVEDFFSLGIIDEIIVVDNNSTDGSDKLIKETDAKYILETTQGYGAACQRGLREAAGDYIILCEPDGTFLARDIHKYLPYLEDVDVVFGTRTSKDLLHPGANMGRFLLLGNEFVAMIVNFKYQRMEFTDVGCTFKIIKKEALDKIKDEFQEKKSAFNPEFMCLCLKHKIPLVEVPVNYGQRIGTSKITGNKWKAFKLGLKMIWLIIRR
jgi:glycosyltransferase involved in cell wall biosynthesis